MKIAIRTRTAGEHKKAIEYIRNVLGFDGKDDPKDFDRRFQYTTLGDSGFTQRINIDGYGIIEIPEDLTFPRMMFVCDEKNGTYVKKLVLGTFKSFYVADEIRFKTPTCWVYAIELPKEIIVTLKEIADWKCCDVEQIKIV